MFRQRRTGVKLRAENVNFVKSEINCVVQLSENDSNFITFGVNDD